ncbi:hypothetical protein, variant [Aphanomyces invadans]|nr:hypothetical protein, variant [Aphanomyces invadans]ETW01381.1 hypothetical protein, variant [Aphanomyces invadans]|eukprot:XP_008870379.1 hypothetical protein, variant [Aphanomyces invadans]
MTKPSNPSDTGNGPLAPLPPHYDIMLEFWGAKKGFQRESLMSTDAIIVDGANSSDETQLKRENGSDDDSDIDKPQERRKKRAKTTKATSQGEALEAGFLAIKEGLIHLGTSLSTATPTPPPPPASGATLDDVLRAIQGQSDTMAQLLAHLVSRK